MVYNTAITCIDFTSCGFCFADSLREKSVVKDPPVYPVHSLPMDKAAINTTSFESQQLLRQYNRPISEFDHYVKQHPALPHDLHEKHEYDKRKVYRNPDDMSFHYHRQFQEYNEDRLRRPPHPLDSYDGLLPPQNSYPFEFSGHMHRKNRDEWYPPRPLPPPPIQRHDEVPFLPKIRPAHNKIFPDIRRKAGNDEILIPYKHPDEFVYLHQKRRTSPPRFTTKPRYCIQSQCFIVNMRKSGKPIFKVKCCNHSNVYAFFIIKIKVFDDNVFF